MLRKISVLAASCACLSAMPAEAAVYIFDYTSTSGPLENASGSFTTDGSGLVTAISGTVTNASGTVAITGISSYASAVNVFSIAEPHFDFGGLSFDGSNGVHFNLYYNVGSYYVTDSVFDPSGGGPLGDDAKVTLNISEAVPEAATWAMMLAGFGAMGAAMRRRPRTSVRYA